MPDLTNLFAEIPAKLPEELVQVLLNAPGVRIERIVSHGHRSAEGFWFDQDRSELVVLLQGAATLRFDDHSQVALKAGDLVNIPAHRKHRVEWTDQSQPTIWLAVHYAGREPVTHANPAR